MNTIQSIKPNFIEHEGFHYLEFEGGFYKGCIRCGGEGLYSFNGEHSKCYKCDNTSEKLGEYISDNRADAEKWCHQRALRRAAAQRKADAKAQAARDARDVRIEALKATDPAIVALLQKVYDDENEANADYTKVNRHSNFLCEMARKLFNAADRGLTDNMVVALRRHMSVLTERENDAAAHPVVEGRVVIRGEIMSAKVVEGDYGIAYKILVKDERGFKVWGSLPKAQADEAYDAWYNSLEENQQSRYDFGPAVWLLGADGTDDRGVRGRGITFTATVEASKDDKNFGFFKRPTKGAWLA